MAIRGKHIHGVGWGGGGEGGGILEAGGHGGNRGDLFTWVCQLVRWIRGLFALERPSSALVPGEKYQKVCPDEDL